MAPHSLKHSRPTVSSMAEQIRHHLSDVKVIPSEGLSHWLPSLSTPLGWTATCIDMGAVTPARVLTRHGDDGADRRIGCDVINLLRFNGTVADSVIERAADATLRDLGADAPITYRVTMPAESGVIATRSRGIAVLGARLWVQVTNYVVLSAGDGALIEHSILVDARSRKELRSDVTQLSKSVRSALITSVSGQRSRTPDRYTGHGVAATPPPRSPCRIRGADD